MASSPATSNDRSLFRLRKPQHTHQLNLGHIRRPSGDESANEGKLASSSKARFKKYGFGKRLNNTGGDGAGTILIALPPASEAEHTRPARQVTVKESINMSTIQRSLSYKAPSPTLLLRGSNHSRGKSINSNSPKRNTIAFWDADAVRSPVEASVEPISPSSPMVRTSSAEEGFSPLPAQISLAAAKRLGIEVEMPDTPHTPDLDSPVDWALFKPLQTPKFTFGFTPPSRKATFYSTDSDSDEQDDTDPSLSSSGSSRTSYNVSTPQMDPSSSPGDYDKPLPAEQLNSEDKVTAQGIGLKLLPLMFDKPTTYHQPTHQLQNSTSSTNTYFSSLQSPVHSPSRSFSKPLPPLLSQHQNNNFAHANSLAPPHELDGNTLKAVPPLPPRSQKREMIKNASTKSQVDNTVTSTSSEISTSRDSVHPALRHSPRPSQTANERRRQAAKISANAAETVILHILESIDDLQNLFATARVNRGFYSVFKRYELRLMKNTLWNMSPAAWELRESSVREIIVTFPDGPSIEYSPTRYLQFHRRDTYILASLKSLILLRCQAHIRHETIDSLRDRTHPGSGRFDNALWRIWTFCTIFGSGKGREADLVGQMDWLKGGVIAHCTSTSANINSVATISADSVLANAPASFGRGNLGGLQATELLDMLEMWTCLRALLSGILGPGRAAQARKHGIFGSLPNEGQRVEEHLLKEWLYYLPTLGLSTVLDLATPSTSKTTRVFNIAEDMGWKTWAPLPNEASRGGFLQDAASRVYAEKTAAAQALATAVAAAAAAARRDNPPPVNPPVTRRASLRRSTASEDRPMRIWLEYMSSRLEPSQKAPFLPPPPPPPSSAPPFPPTTSVPALKLDTANTMRPHPPLRTASSLSLFPTPSARDQSQVQARAPPPTPLNSPIRCSSPARRGSAGVGGKGEGATLLKSRFSVQKRALKARESAPELRVQGGVPVEREGRGRAWGWK